MTDRVSDGKKSCTFAILAMYANCWSGRISIDRVDDVAYDAVLVGAKNQPCDEQHRLARRGKEMKRLSPLAGYMYG